MNIDLYHDCPNAVSRVQKHTKMAQQAQIDLFEVFK